MALQETFKRVKEASRKLALIDDQQKNKILNTVADAILSHQDKL